MGVTAACSLLATVQDDCNGLDSWRSDESFTMWSVVAESNNHFVLAVDTLLADMHKNALIPDTWLA